MKKLRATLIILTWTLSLAALVITWLVDWRLGLAYALSFISGGIDVALQLTTITPQLEKLFVNILKPRD